VPYQPHTQAHTTSPRDHDVSVNSQVTLNIEVPLTFANLRLLSGQGLWMNKTPKYVASSTWESPEWSNSVVIEGDVAEAVKRLKQEDGKHILVNGSGALVRTLIRDHLLDELRLLVHPVVVGTGIRLFGGESDPAELELADSHVFDNGVIGLTYRPATAVGDEA
jgi:dihydrofolate reductase